MRIVLVPCLKDNYAYLVICEKTQDAAVVDPSEAPPVLEALQREGVTPTAIWNTHHHWDHTGGNKALLDEHTNLHVVAHSSDKGRVPGQTHFAEEGDVLTVGEEVSASILFNPGHTKGAISYYLEKPGAVFTGDTLFLGGCGRLFEGTADDMHRSLSKLAALPKDTQIYCGHEYTASNLRFAATVEPENADVGARQARVAKLTNEPTIPAPMSEELLTNPFLRTQEAAVIAAAKGQEPGVGEGPAEILGALRRWKNAF